MAKTILIVIITINLYVKSTLGETPVAATTSEHLIDDEPHDPHQECKYHYGEYYRDPVSKSVCCANDTLTLPDALIHDQRKNEAFAECSKKFGEDNTSDFPTAMWMAFLCKLEKSGAFKVKGKITFEEVASFITQHYPPTVKDAIKKLATKCSAVDSQKLENHIKIEKYMECFYDAENKTCHKPYEGNTTDAEDIAESNKHGCPAVPGLVYQSSVEFCCKKRSTPYPITVFPGTVFYNESVAILARNCRDSFGQREMELNPAAFQSATPTSNDDGEDHTIHSTWDLLCTSACLVQRKNYTSSMLKLDYNEVLDFYTQGFGESVKSKLKQIIQRRKKEKIFLSMDVDVEKSKPMTYDELVKKFATATEKDKIEYYCKFVDTIDFEERRALHEYCFDEKYGNEWSTGHHSFFVKEDEPEPK